MKTYLVYMTAANAAEAEKVGAALIEKRLAACVNILEGARSMFWWDGEVQAEDEVVFLAKTAQDRLEALTSEVRRVHSYDVPCVVALPMEGGNPEFLEWIVASTRPDAAD